jgi:hypothetical protein
MSNVPEAKEKTASNKAPVISYGPYSSGQGNSIELAIWSNEIVVDGGRKVNMHTVTFARNYHDDDGWKKTKTLRPQDIPVLMYALTKAQEWIFEHQRSTD